MIDQVHVIAPGEHDVTRLIDYHHWCLSMRPEADFQQINHQIKKRPCHSLPTQSSASSAFYTFTSSCLKCSSGASQPGFEPSDNPERPHPSRNRPGSDTAGISAWLPHETSRPDWPWQIFGEQPGIAPGGSFDAAPITGFLVGLAVADMVDPLEGRDDFFIVGDDDDRSVELAGHLVEDPDHR